MEKLLCIIPARGGSKRIPRKNVLDFNGKPIISYSIDAVKKSGIASVVMVSTDDEEIKDISLKNGADVPFMRKADTANDKAGLVDVLLEVVSEYKKQGKCFEYVMCVLATAPLINPINLSKAFALLQKTEDANSICSVEVFSYPPQRGLIKENGFLRMKYPENYYARSQDLEKIYHDCGQFFIFRTDVLETERKMYTSKMIPFELSETESQDIDNFVDWKMAELKYSLLYGETR